MDGTGRGGRMPRVRSLRLRFVLSIATLVALVLVANSLVLALANRPRLREDLESRAQAFARLSVAQVCNAYETYYASGYSKFREIVQDKMKLEPDLVRLVIYDTRGSVLFDSRELRSELAEPVQRGAPTPAGAAGAADGAAGRLLGAVQGMSPAAWTTEDGRVYVVMAPYVEEWGRHRYSVAFSFGYDSLRPAALSAGWRIFWLSAGSLALGVLIAILLAAQSVRPIEVLTRGAQDLADGHLARRIELATGDEFGVLAATFNQMAEKLARTISDLETSNQTLGQMNLELQQLDRMKSDLLANVSHELRTPLTAIQGYTEAMDEGLLGPVNSQQRDAFKVVQRNSRRLMGMIEQLLAFSRLDALAADPADAAGAVDPAGAAPRPPRLRAAGVPRLDLEAFDIVEVAAQVVGSVCAAGHGAAPDLRLEVSDGAAAGAPAEEAAAAAASAVGAAGGPGEKQKKEDGKPPGRLPLVWGDPGRIAEVLENLVTNAVKFTPPGGEVRVRLSRHGEEVEVAVADRGIGIPAAAHAKIFERFYQLDTSSTRAYGGMGLGLAIVREILAAHHCAIRVESEEGKGATFRFSLPLAAPETGASRQAAGRRIALVDDDPGFAHLLAGFLKRSGFAVDVSPTAREGFERVVAARPDLVLLDRLLPDGDGFDLLYRLRRDERTAGIPVLVVSVRKERAQGLRLGASGYLVKPVRPARIKEVILETLGQPQGAPGNAPDQVPEVLVVDDDDDLRHLLVQRLQGDGLRARGAADGGEALALIAARRPALVLLDLMMPDVDGWETLRRLRADPATAELPVIVLSARDGAAERAAGEELHVVDFVGKPFDLGSLLEEIERMLTTAPAGAPSGLAGPAGRREGAA